MTRTLGGVFILACFLHLPCGEAADGQVPTYQELRAQFTSPDHARWGEVPLWWWEGDRMTKERVTWQLETLCRAGVKSVCPIQRSPGRCDPQSFSPQWWDMLVFVHRECQRLGMTLWAYDQVGYGHYGWLEKAAAKARDPRTKRIQFLTADSSPQKAIRLELPDGKLLDARAFPLRDGVAVDGESLNLADAVSGRVLQWTPPPGTWRVAVSVTVADQVFQLSDSAGDTFLDMFYGEIERRLGHEAMGKSFVGIFQDEHPPTPRDVYTDELAETFRRRFGYEMARAIPALHFDVGPLTPKYRSDFFDAYLEVDERCYWKRIYDWTAQRGLLTSHDNWGRENINRQSQGYIDYFRTQRWFSAPGFDDAGTAPVTGRNYYDTKIAASIARLYSRPRVWSEAFHSSGWGRTTDQTLSWLSTNYVFGANLYDEHGLYYSTRASTWEHAAPDPHWRQPYWCYYQTLSDWVARTSSLMSQGTHVVDVAVHYPVVSLLAGEAPGQKTPDYNHYMQLSRALFDAAIDNDIIDDDSIFTSAVQDGRLEVGGNGYQVLVFGPETTMRRSVLRKAFEFAERGGTVIFAGGLPSATTEGGRDDPQLAKLLERMLGDVPADAASSNEIVARTTPGGGFVALMPNQPDRLPTLVSDHLSRDFDTTTRGVFVTHRRIGDLDVYFVQNATDEAMDLEAVCRVDGVPEIWDSFTGKVQGVDWFERRETGTAIKHRLEGNVAKLFVFRPGDRRQGSTPSGLLQPDGLEIELSDDWAFSVIPTRDNRWGEFRWPPSQESIGPEIRSFRYKEETARSGVESGWHRADFEDADWSVARYSIGPYWLCLPNVPAGADVAQPILDTTDEIRQGSSVECSGKSLTWQTVEYSQTIGLARPAPWGGHSGYPDGAIDQNFIELPASRKLLFSRISSPKTQRLGLRVELRNATARLWVNGTEQPLEDAVGNLPLEKGENSVLLDLPDGKYGMLYVQQEPPSVRSLADAARTMVAPDLREASWILGEDPVAAYVRKTFQLDAVPSEARVVVTAYTGYRLFINGVKIEEEIGPWAKWTHPESFNVTRHLRQGENVIAGWIQVHAGQNVHGAAEKKGLALAMKVRQPNGEEFALVSDGTWRAADGESPGWQDVGFDDSQWQKAEVLGRMGAEPWGTAPLENLGVATEPYRALSIDLPSPYLTCFDATSDIIYDVKPQVDRRVGWYRFVAPPGLKTLTLPTSAAARVWVDGKEAEVQDGVVQVAVPPVGISNVAIRLDMQPGAYGGAAFPLPPRVELQGGRIQPGLWADLGLPTYSGIGVYRQNVRLTPSQQGRRTILDLGQVLVAAEVFVNDRSAGVRLARPFQFDLSKLLREGENTIEVHVANTIAPHYTVTNRVQNLGPTDSGLLGPVTLKQELSLPEWKSWATAEIERLGRQLDTPTAALEAAQLQWEKNTCWNVLQPTSADGTESDEWVPLGGLLDKDKLSFRYLTTVTNITGFRLEMTSGSSDAVASGGSSDRPTVGEVSIVARPADNKPYRGRYIRIEIPDRAEHLHMAEVQVFSSSENVARRGRATQSSTTGEAVADRALDGDTNGSWGGNSVTHTNNQAHPWWEVDLGTLQTVNRIVIFNRTDGNLENRLRGFRVSLLDESRQVVWRQQVTQPPDPQIALHLSPVPIDLIPSRVSLDASQVVIGHEETDRHVAVMRTKQRVGFARGTLFEVDLKFKGPAAGVNAGLVRMSVTTMESPIRDIPPSIADIVATAASERTTAEASTLAAFYRSIAPELKPVRDRLDTLESEALLQQESAGLIRKH